MESKRVKLPPPPSPKSYTENVDIAYMQLANLCVYSCVGFFVALLFVEYIHAATRTQP